MAKLTHQLLNEAYDIAMQYLISTGQAHGVEVRVADAIMFAHSLGMMHRVALANEAIVAVESGRHVDLDLPSFYPRVG